ncbi:MAG: YqgE/AlgH family protein [Flavobacteriaceae bacterium]|nr:YqgE/AlgH family protein [Flavobacteriaceae bacterium]
MIQGNIIISNPHTTIDSIFNRSVILLADHNKTASTGFIINKPLNIYLKELIPEINIKFKIFFGGPVNKNNLFFIHNSSKLIPNSIEIDENFHWGGDFEKVIELIKLKKLTSKDIRFFLGYSGWNINQLLEEQELNSWIIKDNIFKKKLLNIESENLWKNLIKSIGGDYLIWSNSPENPNLN